MAKTDASVGTTPAAPPTPQAETAEKRAFSKNTYSDSGINYPIGKYDLGTTGVSPKTMGLINSSLLQARIIPRTMIWADGLSQFALNPNWKDYSDLIKKYDVSLPLQCVDVMFTPDNLPSDTFGNEYGASFLANVLDVFKGAISDANQMLGNTDLASNLGTLAKAVRGDNPGLLRQAAGGAIDYASQVAGDIDAAAAQRKPGDNKWVTGALSSAMAMMAGARVDFPSVWKDSTFQPTCSITIKLYNPYPGLIEQTKKYITRPLAALLCLALPQSRTIGNDANLGVSAYTWPFFCSIVCPGVFTMPYSAISNISVQKSGDQPLATFNQLISQVNVTMDFISLYPTMIAGAKPKNRLHLQDYLTNLETPQDFGVTTLAAATSPAPVDPNTNPTANGSVIPRSLDANKILMEDLLGVPPSN